MIKNLITTVFIFVVSFAQAADIVLGTTAQGVAWEGVSPNMEGRFYDKVDSYTKLLLHCDGTNTSKTVIDSSSSNYVVTAVGTAQLDTSQKKFGTASLLLDGNSDYLTVPDNNDWSLGYTYTVDTWVRFNSKAGDPDFFSQRKSGVNVVNFYFDSLASNLIHAVYIWSGDVTPIAFRCPWNPTVNTWYHLALVRIDNGNAATSWRIFIDGVSQTLTLTAGAWNGAYPDVGEYLAIGRNGDGDSNYLNGWLDEFRISKGIARWTNNFTPPTRSYNE
jgi:hypothetical protein